MQGNVYVHKENGHFSQISTNILDDENLILVDSFPPNANYKFVDGKWIPLESKEVELEEEIENDSLNLLKNQIIENLSNKYDEQFKQAIYKFEVLENYISKITEQNNNIINLVQENLKLTIKADDTLDIESVKELIISLSQVTSEIAKDNQAIKDSINNSNNHEELYNKLSELLNQNQAEEEQEEEEQEEEYKEPEINPVSLQIYGSSEYIDGVFSVNNKDYSWRSGFRTTSQSIEKPGEFFEWQGEGSFIVGVTRFPLKNESWKNAENFFYFLNDKKYWIYSNYQRVNISSFNDQNKLRLAINKDKKIEWQIIDKENNIHTVYESNDKVTSKLFLFASLPINSKVWGINIGKID